MSGLLKLAASLLLLASPLVAWSAPIELIDDAGKPVRLKQPANRIISLAPHLTELVYSIGAGDKLVGVTEYSDFPEQAKHIPRVGSASAIDLEKIISLEPDLVLIWKSGTPVAHQERLARLGIPLVVFGFGRLDDVARGIVQLGELTGQSRRSREVQQSYRHRLQQISKTYGDRKPVRVFYQLWAQPTMTVNRRHILSHMIRVCGGKNIFADLESLTPSVDIESVLRGAPEIIIDTSIDGVESAKLGWWRKWPSIPAVRHKHLYTIQSDLLVRQSTRLLTGLEQMCRLIDRARAD